MGSRRFPSAMLRTVIVVVTVAVCAARPGQLEDQLGLFPADDGDSQSILPRAVPNPKTPNQILDAIIEGAVEYMENIGWCSSKRVQNGESILPFDVNSGAAESSETFSITAATVTGLCNLRRSKSASFNSDETVLTGTVVVDDARVNADYKVVFPGTGQAPANTVTGQVVELVNKLFADIQVNLADLVPQNIRSYTTRSGHDGMEQATGLEGNAMEAIDMAGFRKALLEILEKTMSSNVKVQINKSIQDMKSA